MFGTNQVFGIQGKAISVVDKDAFPLEGQGDDNLVRTKGDVSVLQKDTDNPVIDPKVSSEDRGVTGNGIFKIVA